MKVICFSLSGSDSLLLGGSFDMRALRSILALTLILVGLTACRGEGNLRSEPEQLIDNATAVAKGMFSDPNFASMLNLTNRSKGVLIVPSMLRAGFIWGARTGNGVLLMRDADGRGWSQPAFYTLGGVNWGLQAGVQDQQIIIVIMTERGLNAVMRRSATLGADASVSAGELGRGYNAATGVGINSDMYAFAKTSGGLFAGLALEGSWIEQRDSWNREIYGENATPRGILSDRTFSAPQTANLIAAMP
jgi:SH3 domain-containing YSC84-like protein 1